MKKYFIIDYDDDFGDVLLLVTEEDYNSGYNMSLSSSVMTDDLYDIFDKIGCGELQDGLYEVMGDVEEVRTILIELGFEEKQLQ